MKDLNKIYRLLKEVDDAKDWDDIIEFCQQGKKIKSIARQWRVENKALVNDGTNFKSFYQDSLAFAKKQVL